MQRKTLNEQSSSKGIYDQLPSTGKDTEEPTVGSDVPIDPSQQMATQLSTERPPVEDEEFVPSSLEELQKAASAISEKVPSGEIEWYYKQLQGLLEKSIDRDGMPKDEKEEDKELKKESKKIRKVIRAALRGILSEQSSYKGSERDKEEFDTYRGTEVDYFGEEPAQQIVQPSSDAVSLEDLADEFGYSGAPGMRQEINRLTDRMEYFATKVKKEDLSALTDFAVGEYIDAMEKSDLLDLEDIEDLRSAPNIVKDMDSFRFFFVSAFILPAYKQVAREANKRVKSEIDDLGLPKEIHQTIFNQVTGATKQDPALISKKLSQLAKSGKIKSDEIPEVQEKIRSAISVLKLASDPSDDLVQKSLDKWQSMNASKRKSLLMQSLEQTADFQEA
tara:strand:- start:6597 stop:7766 length:1170 start_codon:yes stop_codon:yes gene_type:complete